jgi:hypothetical protein
MHAYMLHAGRGVKPGYTCDLIHKFHVDPLHMHKKYAYTHTHSRDVIHQFRFRAPHA